MSFSGNKPDRAEALFLLAFFGAYAVMALWGLGGYWEKFGRGELLIAFTLFPVMLLVNRYVLIPEFFLRKKRVLYSVILSGSLIVLEFVKQRYVDAAINEGGEKISVFTPALAGVILSWIIFLSKDWFEKNERIAKINAEKVKYELDYLKGQINPHFLFNAMNSIYSRALEENAPGTADHIADLSYLLRYNLYDSARDFILLEKETEFLKKYIRIQQARLSPNTRIVMKFPEPPLYEISIAPLLCIPLIENLFKHGVNPARESEVTITMEMNNDELCLQTENMVFYPEKSPDSGGIGLANLKRRLEIIYPGRHSLKTRTADQRYFAELSIKLK